MGIPLKIAAVALLAATGLAAAADYRIAPRDGDRFTLSVEKTGFLRGKKHIFEYPRYSGSLTYDAASPASASVRFQIEAASAIVKDDWGSEKDHRKVLDQALKEMDASKHPSLTFVSRRVEPAGEGKFRVSGDLEIRGVKKPCEILVTVTGSGAGFLSVEGTSSFRMSTYGIKPPSAALGAVGTRDEMEVRFMLRAVQ